MANNYPYFPFYVSDFDGDTRHMAVESIGIYIRLLIYQWTNGKIPSSEAMMVRIAGCSRDQFMESWENEIGQCFEQIGDGAVTSFRNKRLHIERQKVLAATEQRRQAGKKSGESRRKSSKKQPHRTSVPFPFEREGNETATIQSHNHTKTKPTTGRFAEFWEIYPKKIARKPCEVKWKARRLDRLADQIIQNVKDRIEGDSRWLRGYVPNPMTYINQDRWDDPIEKESAGEKSQRSRTESFDDIHARNREKAGLD